MVLTPHISQYTISAKHARVSKKHLAGKRAFSHYGMAAARNCNEWSDQAAAATVRHVLVAPLRSWRSIFRETIQVAVCGAGRMKVPPKQRKKARLWLNDGSCVRLRPDRPNHVWSYDFVQDRTDDGRTYRTLNIIDEFTREALMICVARKLNSTDVVDALIDRFGVPFNKALWSKCRKRQIGLVFRAAKKGATLPRRILAGGWIAVCTRAQTWNNCSNRGDGRSTKPRHALIFQPGYLMGAGQRRSSTCRNDRGRGQLR